MFSRAQVSETVTIASPLLSYFIIRTTASSFYITLGAVGGLSLLRIHSYYPPGTGEVGPWAPNLHTAKVATKTTHVVSSRLPIFSTHTFLPDILHSGGQGVPNTLGSTPVTRRDKQLRPRLYG